MRVRLVISTISAYMLSEAPSGASTNLTALMSHAGTVSYTNNYQAEATTVHGKSKKYFIAETNSGASPSFHPRLPLC